MQNTTANGPTIPLEMRHALESGECVLFLGAGIGRHMLDQNGKPAPNGSQLAQELAEHFEIDAEGSTDLAKISQVVEIRKRGRKELHAFLQKRLANLTPDNDLQWLLSRPWKAIYTTNYDEVIERAFQLNPAPVQQPVVATVTADLVPINNMFEVPIFHLHGTLFGNKEPHIIITEDDYTTFRERRHMLFELLKTEFATSTIIYVGYSHNDNNWKILLSELIAEFAEVKRPNSFRISPETPSLDIEILRAKGVDTIESGLSDFVKAAQVELVYVPRSADRLKKFQESVPVDLAEHFEKSPAAMMRLLSSWTYVNQAPFHEKPNVKRFLRGDRANWGLISRREFFERDVEETVYERLLDFATGASKRPSSSVVLGSAGYGMSTLVTALAARLVQDRAGPVFMHKAGTPFLEGDVLYAASLFPDKRPFFVVDNASDYNSGLLDCIHRLADGNRPVLFLLADRLNEWRQGRGKLNATEFIIEPLSDPEIMRLLEFLECHGELNTLEFLTPELRFAAVKNRHQKELLVAMREATEDKSFDAIIEDEYMSIRDDKARQVYLTVCCFYQHGALIRDGLLAGLVGMNIAAMYKVTADITEGVVIYECNDPVNSTYSARARHRTIATIVWERCGDSAQKENLLQAAISSLNLNYRADAEAFEQFIRSDHLVDSIRTLDGRTKLFETATRKDPHNPYVRQHYARMLTRADRHELALSQIERAIELNVNIRVLYHTQGVVLSKLALQAESTDLARRRLAQAEQAFRRALNMYPRDEYCYCSLAKLYFEWAKQHPAEQVEYMTKCEEMISEGLRAVASKEGLWLISAEILNWIGDQPARMDALQKAVREQPTSVQARHLLARAYRRAGKPEEAIRVLDPVLRDNLNEFRLCIEYALCLDEMGEAYDKAIAILQLGTTFGLSDSRFIAIYGGMLFMNRKFSDADRVFAETSRHDFSPADANSIQYRPKARKGETPWVELRGTVRMIRAGYAFIEVIGYPQFFCPSSKQKGITLRHGMLLNFEPGFSPKGPIADNLSEVGEEKAEKAADKTLAA